MLELIKKSLLTGLGMAVVAKEKLERAAKNLVDEGKLSQGEAEALIKELLESGEGQWKNIERQIKQFVKEGIDGLDLCSKKELDQLQKKVEELEQKLAKKE